MFEELMPEGQDYKLCKSPESAHYKIIKYVGANKKVLDVGCGAGYLGEEFKNNGCYVVGLESNVARAKTAKGILDNVVIADAESLSSLSYPEGFFDVIVFTDILEHLKRPDNILRNFKKYLNKDGFAIISVPNIARIDIRIKLLFGKFRYAQGGILDRTHLRFFTLDTIQGLVRGAGYKIEKMDFSGFFSKLKILRFLANLLAFQFILLVRPRSE